MTPRRRWGKMAAMCPPLLRRLVLGRGLSAALLALFALAPTASAGAAAFTATVVYIGDGDTLYVKTQAHKRARTLRIAAIDAPEKDQPGGAEAKAKLAALCPLAKPATVTPKATDRYHRTVARVACGGVDVSRAMVRAGLAWAYSREAGDGPLYNDQRRAMNERRGLWAAPNPIPPWDWRKTHSSAPATPAGASQRAGPPPGATVHIGPRGGHYYYGGDGKKVYLPHE